MATIRISSDPEAGTVYEDPATRQKEMEITEKWLGEIGGWQAMKAARLLLAAGRVRVTEQGSDFIAGLVGGEKALKSGLRIRSKSDVETLCTCPTARRTGQICDHALAVGLAGLQKSRVQTPISHPPSTGGEKKQPEPGTALPTTIKAPGRLSLYLPESLLLQGSSGGRAAAFLKLEPGDGEVSRLARWLTSRGVSLENTPLSLPSSELATLLEASAEHPRLFVGKPAAGQFRPLVVAENEIRPLIRVKAAKHEGDDDLPAILQWSESPAPMVVTIGKVGDLGWLYHPGSGTIHPWKSPGQGEVWKLASELFEQSRNNGEVRRPWKWMAQHLPDLEEYFQIELDASIQERYKCVECPSYFEMFLDGNLKAVTLSVEAVFQKSRWQITSAVDPFPIEDESIKGQFYLRNKNNEKGIFDSLLGFGFQLNPTSGDFEIRDSKTILQLLSSNLKKLRSLSKVSTSSAWESAIRNIEIVTPKIRKSNDSSNVFLSGTESNDWLSMEFAYQAENGFHLSRAEVLRLIRSGQNSLRGRDGRHYLLDVERCLEMEEALQDVPVQLTQSGMRLKAAHQAYFMPFSDRAELAAVRDTPIDVASWRDKLRPLGDALRAYQIEGVAWLAQRLMAGQGALLGDDMGLGKTVQSIAAVQWLLQNTPRKGRQALIVCPKSLIPNWETELKRFCPSLNSLSITGSQRGKLLKETDCFDVLITSYPLISRDLNWYQNRDFEVGIFDEASFLRNPDTETSRAVRSLKLHSRIALSGTPVENGVRDLWSIFAVLLPGYLNDQKTFHERFEKPMQQSKQTSEGQAAAERLRRLIRPFFLRRTKREVLRELPEKIEQVFWCEMNGVQAEVYRRILDEGREEIRAARRRTGQNGARMTMLTVLLRLRQACCDVGLAGVPEEILKKLRLGERSAKWEALDERLNEALDGGSKVLIFSQFVSYLQALRMHLDSRGIPLAYLDGGTQDRAAQVEAFQKDPLKRVFLISLKAGGYGLNLTQADQVFLMDPWWNPAVESQAIDRAHRYGQSRVVNAYRFVMRGTVEERVLALQEKKRGIISATVEERAPMMEGLSDADLESLLEL